MTKIKQLTNVLALCTIVGLSCWVGYLLAENERISYEKYIIKQRDSLYIDALLNVDIKQDSVINGMPPVNIEIDDQGNYSFTYN